MPIISKVDQSNAIIKVINSSIVEFISAIQVLADSRHHGFESEWADTIYKQLSRKSLLALSKLSEFPFQGLEYLEFSFCSGNYDDIKTLLTYIDTLPNHSFLYYLFESILNSETIEMVTEGNFPIDQLLSEEPTLSRFSKETLQYVFHSTNSFKKEISDLMNELLRNIDFTCKLEDAIKKCSDAVVEMKIDALTTDPQTLVCKAIRKKWPLEKFNEYIFVPSYFISPHHLLLIFNNALLIAYDARNNEESIKESNTKITNKLNALTDKTRLEILRILISQPTYNKVLSAMLTLSTATISHHLEVLRNAELVNERQSKKMRIYSANIDEINKLVDDLKNYLYNK